MAPTTVKKPVVKKTPKCECDCAKKLVAIIAEIDALKEIVKGITDNKVVKTVTSTINKFEAWEQPPVEAPQTSMKMTLGDKIRSATNAIKILPPNLVDEKGRHTAQNIGAICGFLVDEDMLETLYGDSK